MNLVAEVKNRLGNKKKTIVLPETDDPRVLKAASRLVNEQLCSVILLGKKEILSRKAISEGIDLPDSIRIIEFDGFPQKEKLISEFYNRQKHKGLSKDKAEEAIQSPLFFGASLVSNGFADGCVAGSIATTGEVIRAAIKCIGLSENSSIVSSIFLMVLPEGKVMTYGDCGVVPYPNREQLATIAIDSARTHKLITNMDPVVAMLSFSTKGSAQHESIELVTDALNKAREIDPDLSIDGELQFDAAFVPEIGNRKAPESQVAGKANVFIFPNLDAGNIAYKITERLGGARATGPILQGLDKPMMDLSRGCSWNDIVDAACVAMLMAKD